MTTHQDLSKISAEKYFADLFTTGIKNELDSIAERIIKEAEAKFRKEADDLMKNYIFKMVRNFKVTRELYPTGRAEIIVQLPILEELNSTK